MTLRTVAQARACHCPIARVRGEEKPPAKCVGPDCILWRYAPILADDPRVLSAITREVTLMKGEVKPDEKQPADETLRKKAVAKIAANPDGYIIRDEKDRGWCGLGSRPE